MTCAEFKEHAQALALGALDPAERQACEAHLAEPIAHDGCREALARALDTVALLAAAAPAERPGPGLWRSIEREIGAAAGARATSERRSLRREVLAWGLAAAAAVVAVVLGLEWRLSERRVAEKDRAIAIAAAAERDKQICLRELATARVSLREKEAALSLIREPGTQLVQLAPQVDEPYHASAIVNPERGSAMVLTRALEPQEDKDYQLWLIRGDEKVSAGILHTDASGATVARVAEEALAGGRPDAFAVTVEPRGGMPQPTGPIVLLGKMPSA